MMRFFSSRYLLSTFFALFSPFLLGADTTPASDSLLGEWAVRPPGQGTTAIFRFEEDGTVTNLTAEGFGQFTVLPDDRMLIEFPDGIFIVKVRALGEKRVLQGTFGMAQPLNLTLVPPTDEYAAEAEETHKAFVEQATRYQSQQIEMAIRNNLRQLASAAQQYMLDEGTDSVSFADLVGAGKPIGQLESINGEDYSDLVFDYDTFTVSVTDADGRKIEYNF